MPCPGYRPVRDTPAGSPRAVSQAASPLAWIARSRSRAVSRRIRIRAASCSRILRASVPSCPATAARPARRASILVSMRSSASRERRIASSRWIAVQAPIASTASSTSRRISTRACPAASARGGGSRPASSCTGAGAWQDHISRTSRTPCMQDVVCSRECRQVGTCTPTARPVSTGTNFRRVPQPGALSPP